MQVSTLPGIDTELWPADYETCLELGTGKPNRIARNYVRDKADQYGYFRRMDLLPLIEMYNQIILFDVWEPVLIPPEHLTARESQALVRLAKEELLAFLRTSRFIRFKLS